MRRSITPACYFRQLRLKCFYNFLLQIITIWEELRWPNKCILTFSQSYLLSLNLKAYYSKKWRHSNCIPLVLSVILIDLQWVFQLLLTRLLHQLLSHLTLLSPTFMRTRIPVFHKLGSLNLFMKNNSRCSSSFSYCHDSQHLSSYQSLFCCFLLIFLQQGSVVALSGESWCSLGNPNGIHFEKQRVTTSIGTGLKGTASTVML